MKESVLIFSMGLLCLLVVVVYFAPRSSETELPTPQPPATVETDVEDSAPAGEVPRLTSTSWVWEETRYPESENVLPKEPGTFILSFIDEDRFGAQTDCNNVGGTYTLEDTTISFSQMMATKMGCLTETQEEVFTEMLGSVEAVSTDEDGRLLLRLDDGVGLMVFSYLPG